MAQTNTIPLARKLLVPTVVYTMFVGGLFLACFQFSLYYMAEEYGFGSTVMGLLTSVQFAFMILFTIPLGKLAYSLLTVVLSGQIVGLIQRIPYPGEGKKE